MSDVFISYKRENLAVVNRLVEALRAESVDVWWDQDIPPNAPWEATIEKALAAAKLIIVAWSPASVASDNVKAEARWARGQGRLLQVFVEACEPPLFFGERQGVDLKGWSGGATDPAFRSLVAAAKLSGASPNPPETSSVTSPPPPLRPEFESNNLPKRLPSLFGRQAELGQIEGLLARSGLVTITGSGGVGKTRLAIEVAERTVGQYEDGAWLVELAPVSDAELVPSAIARSMAIELAVGQPPLEALIDRLRLRECLIVLDNCEHVIDAAAGFAGAILDASSGIKLLASSQELLGIESEQVFRLRSLDEADASALFAARATAADADFAIRPRDRAAIEAICQRLDGIPLAIEMAAARAPSLGCEGVLQRLDDRFRLLTGGRRTALPRQRTLAATLDWSHGLLPERDAKVLRRLGVFSGGFTLEAASDVAADSGLDSFEVVDAVSSLVAKSLVSADPGAESPRYRLLETTRVYALEKLNAAGETLATQRKHAEWVLKFVRPIDGAYDGHIDDDTFAERYFGENDNLERALDWSFGPSGDGQLGIAIVAYSEAVWACQSLYNDYLRWLDVAGDRLDEAQALPIRARFHAARATSLMMNHPARAMAVVDDAIEVCREHGNPIELARVLNAKGFALYITGRGAEARGLADESMQVVASLPTGRTPAQSKMLAGYMRFQSNGFEAAKPLLDEGVADLRAFNAHGLANWFESTTLVLNPPPDSDAIVVWREILARIRPRELLAGLTFGLAVGRLLSSLARRAAPGDAEEAIDAYRRTYKLMPEGFSRISILLSMGLVAAAQGRMRDAALIEGRVEAFATEVGGAAALERELDELRSQLRAVLPPEELEGWLVEGAKLPEDEALLLAAGPS